MSVKNHATNPKAQRIRRHGEARLARAEKATQPTAHELRVLAVYIDAGSVKETARRLELAERTIDGLLSNVRSKVGAQTNAQAVWILRSRIRPTENRG